MIPTVPVKTFYLCIWTLLFIYPKIQVLLIQRIISTQNRIFFDHFLCTTASMRPFPWIFIWRSVILNVFNVTTTLQHNCFQPFLCQFFRSPSTTYPRTDYNCVISICCHLSSNYLFLNSYFFCLVCSICTVDLFVLK